MNKITAFVKKHLIKILMILCILMAVLCYIPSPAKEESATKTYNEFIALIEKDEVKEVNISPESDKFEFITADEKTYETDNPRDDNFKKFLLENDVKVNELSPTFFDNLLGFIATYGISIVILIVFITFALSFKRETVVKNYEIKENTGVLIEDVVIPSNIKKDISRNIDFLKNPSKYSEQGVRMPKGMILYGSPGTGKTMIAKAIANEAGVPFYYASGSEFVELYVGQGARRIRSLFKEAQEHAPCVIFIDEIDAIGGVRGNRNSTENDQSINALLTCLDGFNSSLGIFVIAATNRIDILDPGLIREGRFDQHVQVPLPSQMMRKQIIENCIGKLAIPHDKLDSLTMAKKTLGFSGATLSALVNETGLCAIDANKEEVDMSDFERAYEKIAFKAHRDDGVEKKNDDDLEITATHEAGHAIISALMCHRNVEMVTIIGTVNGAGGFTMSETEEKGIYTKKELEDAVRVLYGGSAAEMVRFGQGSTGASNDFERATDILNSMAKKYGMMNTLLNTNGNVPEKVGADQFELINKTASNLYFEVVTFLKENEKLLMRVTEELKEKESLNNEEFSKIILEEKENSVIKGEVES